MANSLTSILEALSHVVDADLAVILSVEDKNTLRVRAAAGRLAKPELEHLKINLKERPQLAAAISGQRACVIHDEEEHDVHEPDTYSEAIEMPDSHTCMAAPLRADGRLVGVLTLDALACRAFNDIQVRAVDGFAYLAALVLSEEERANRLSRELDKLVARSAEEHSVGGVSLIGSSAVWRELVGRIKLVAPTPTTVLITGETGTGKEQAARALHQWSTRAGGPFVALNCSVLSPELALSELFGHEKGAFTGADRRRDGRFGLAEGGTLFLDEVADLPAKAQAQLLRVVQERVYERVGGAGDEIEADVRLVTATHKNLESEIREGRFREDLFYRLSAFPIHMPALKQRIEDLPLLAAHFINVLKDELNMPKLGLSRDTLQALREHDWPGNVRELRNVLERAAILAGGRIIKPIHLDAPTAIQAAAAVEEHGRDALPDLPPNLTRLDRALALEILSAVEEAQGKIAGADGAARRLGVKPTTLHSTMKRLGLK